MKQAANCAKENITHANQRKAFLKNLGCINEHASNKQQPEGAKSAPAIEQNKQAGNGVQR
jgi:hypothetical protein